MPGIMLPTMEQIEILDEEFASLTHCKELVLNDPSLKGDLYRSDHWEFPWWNRSTQRSWKNHRRTQYYRI